MDLDELRSVQSKERRKDSLQHLRDSFYGDVAEYLADRKRRRDERAASVDSPFSDAEVRKLSDEIDTAEEVVESLYERRVGKVVKLASFAAAGAPADTDGMTAPEAELFEDLVVRIERNKGRVLDVLEADTDAAMDAPDDTAVPAGPEAGTGAEPAAVDAPAATAETDDGTPTTDSARQEPPGSSETPAGNDAGGVLADAMGATSADGAGDATTGGGDSTDAVGAADAGADRPTATTGTAEPAESPSPGGTDDGPSPASPEEFVPGSEPDRAGDSDGTGGTAGPGETDGTNAAGDASDGATDPAGVGADVAPDERTSLSAGDGDSDGGDRRTVRITRDVGEILGVDDIEYELATEDVVTLPSENAAPLVERDAAEPIE